MVFLKPLTNPLGIQDFLNYNEIVLDIDFTG